MGKPVSKPDVLSRPFPTWLSVKFLLFLSGKNGRNWELGTTWNEKKNNWKKKKIGLFATILFQFLQFFLLCGVHPQNLAGYGRSRTTLPTCRRMCCGRTRTVGLSRSKVLALRQCSWVPPMERVQPCPLESYLTSTLGVSLAVFLRVTTCDGFRRPSPASRLRNTQTGLVTFFKRRRR